MIGARDCGSVKCLHNDRELTDRGYMNLTRIHENTQDTYENVSRDFMKLGDLFDQYFTLFVPEEDELAKQSDDSSKSLHDSAIQLFEAKNPAERDALLKKISSETFAITGRINNLYQNFLHQRIDKDAADRITEHIILFLRYITTSYDIYLKWSSDKNREEVKNLFESYVKQSKMLNSTLDAKNKNDPSADQHLELIYSDNDKLNI
jgi:hypothetical protein